MWIYKVIFALKEIWPHVHHRWIHMGMRVQEDMHRWMYIQQWCTWRHIHLGANFLRMWIQFCRYIDFDICPSGLQTDSRTRRDGLNIINFTKAWLLMMAEMILQLPLHCKPSRNLIRKIIFLTWHQNLWSRKRSVIWMISSVNPSHLFTLQDLAHYHCRWNASWNSNIQIWSVVLLLGLYQTKSLRLSIIIVAK